MNVPGDAFVHRGLLCIPDSADPGLFRYVPLAPLPQIDQQGRPQVSLLEAGSLAFLQLSVRWDGRPEDLESLRAEIARRHPEIALDAVRLTPAPAEVEGVSLHVGHEGEGFRELQRGRSSGFPPFTALFNATLTEEGQRADVKAALAGRPGFLRVTYHVSAPREGRVTAELRGDVGRRLDDLPQRPTLAACAAAVERWVESRALRIEVELAGAAVEGDAQEARRRAVQEAARLVRKLRDAPPAGGAPSSTALNVRVEFLTAHPAPQDRTADVADWLRAPTAGASGSR